jgi:DNA transposition AAA+ family ATPase
MSDTNTETDFDIALEEQEQLRADVRRLAEKRKITLTKVADEAGIKYGTFSSWLGGTYAGNNGKVAAEVNKWVVAQSTRDRVLAQRMKSPGFVNTPTAARFMGVLDHAQFATEFVLIGAAAGVGKTSAVERYRVTHSNVWQVTAEPLFKSIHMLMDAIASTMGITEKWSAGTVSRTVQRHMRGSEGLLVIDEVQHLPTASLDQLRTLHDLTSVGVALVGNESVYSKLEGFGRQPQFAQLFRRIGMRMSVPKPTPEDISKMLDAWNIEGPELRRPLTAIARKPGALGVMVKTLRLAFLLGEGTVTPEMIHKAYQQISNTPLLIEAA